MCFAFSEHGARNENMSAGARLGTWPSTTHLRGLVSSIAATPTCFNRRKRSDLSRHLISCTSETSSTEVATRPSLQAQVAALFAQAIKTVFPGQVCT